MSIFNQNQNQFSQAPVLGMLDLHFNPETISAIIDPAASGTTYVAGTAMMIVDAIGGVPRVTPITATTNEVFGYIVFDRKKAAYSAGDTIELSQAGNVMYLYASGAISRGIQVTANITQGSIDPINAHSGADIVGYAYDKATAAGLIRVKLSCPSFQKA